jgi:hypothetical protein
MADQARKEDITTIQRRYFLLCVIGLQLAILSQTTNFITIIFAINFMFLTAAAVSFTLSFSGRRSLQVLSHALVALLAFCIMLKTLHRIYEFNCLGSFDSMSLPLLALNAMAVPLLFCLTVHSFRLAKKTLDRKAS